MIKKIKETFGKLNKGTNLVVIILFAIAIIFFIVISIINAVSPDDSKKDVINEINSSNIQEYIVKPGEDLTATNVVKNYSLFYTLENATENFISFLIDDKIDVTYSILTDSLKNKYNKADYSKKMDEYMNKNFVETKSESDMPLQFTNSSNLMYAYKVSENSYICQTRCMNGDSILIGITLLNDRNNKNHYKVFYLDI